MAKIKILALLLTGVLLVSALSGCQNGLRYGNDCSGWPPPTPTSGTCGENLTWEWSEDHKMLTISGTGSMNDYIDDSKSLPFDYYLLEIKTVIIEDGVTSIGAGAFAGCKNLEEITIPDSVTAIGKGAFEDCECLEEITIPDSVTAISERAFCNTALKQIVIPDSVTAIDERAFYNAGLNHIVIPDSVTTIGPAAFEGCANLTEIVLPDSITEIEYAMFTDCTSLTTITIPGSVTKLTRPIFDGCISLKTVNYIGTELEWLSLSQRYRLDLPDDVTVNFLEKEAT